MNAMPPITGRTRLIFVMADPIAQARAPAMANALLHAAGAEAVLLPLHVAADGLAAAVSGFRAMQNMAGVMVSMPHKQTIMALLDETSPVAQLVGAVNVVRRDADGRLIGHVLDGDGLVGGLLKAGHAVRGQHCLMVGAGGAASAVAYTLAEQGCASLTLLNRTAARAQELAQRLRQAFPTLDLRTQEQPGAEYGVAVNGTSLGMKPGDALPMSDDQILRSRVVAECVLAPEHTALLHRADALGRVSHNGLHMLEAQLQAHLDYVGATKPGP